MESWRQTFLKMVSCSRGLSFYFDFCVFFPAGSEGKMRIYPRLIMTRRTTPLQGPIIGGGEKTIQRRVKGQFIL